MICSNSGWLAIIWILFDWLDLTIQVCCGTSYKYCRAVFKTKLYESLSLVYISRYLVGSQTARILGPIKDCRGR